MRVVATAGHVDHGKSTLVQALTGTDPDRWDEEKRRGLTIDLGFAATTLPSGASIAFVDVPGHVRFLKNMLAGVGAVDACVFVVAATEGWKPQSEEHLRILELLGLGHGVIAVTKVGLVAPDELELVHLDLADRVAGTFLAGAEQVDVDAPTGVGLGALRLALDRLVADTPAAPDRDRPRLWVDRSFAARGAGTILTGTLAGGPLALDDELLVVPGATAVRVRALQSHGEARTRVGPGHRVAVNLVGIGHHDVARGHALVRRDQWHAARTVDASLTVLATLDHAVSRRGAYLLHVGAGEHAVALRVLGPDAVEPGATGLVRLHLPVALPLTPGDRFVLRESGRQETIGGGEVLDVEPVTRAAEAAPDRSVERVLRERGEVEVTELYRLTGEHRSADLGTTAIDPARLAARRAELLDAVDRAGPHGLELAPLDDLQRRLAARLADDGELRIDQGRARAVTSADPVAEHPYLAALDANPFTPPTPDEAGVDPADLRELVRRGLVQREDGVCFSSAAVDEACARLAPRLAAAPDGLTVAEIRDELATTRKYVIPLLKILDGTGRTRRRGDRRIAGPRL